jgi:hypothetical protein
MTRTLAVRYCTPEDCTDWRCPNYRAEAETVCALPEPEWCDFHGFGAHSGAADCPIRLVECQYCGATVAPDAFHLVSDLPLSGHTANDRRI